MVRTIKYSSANLKYAYYNPFPDVLLHYMDKKSFHFLHCTMLNAKNAKNVKTKKTKTLIFRAHFKFIPKFVSHF